MDDRGMWLDTQMHMGTALVGEIVINLEIEGGLCDEL